MNYRSTPHPSTGLSPLGVLFNRKIKTKLPQFSIKSNNRHIRERDTNATYKNKLYTDYRRKSKPCKLKRGDSVLVKQRLWNKLVQS